MPTKSRYRAGVLEFFDSVTHERVLPTAPLVFYDDFLGVNGLLLDETGSDGIWNTREVALNTSIGIRADTANGVVQMTMDSDVNAEDAVLDMGDQRQFNVKAGLVFECRIDVAVLPTLTGQAVFGMSGDHNLDKDATTEAAWFKLDGSGAVLAETDDTTNNNDDIATGVTAVPGTYNIYRIDFTDISNVLFYIDGVAVATGTTFDMSNLTDAEGLMQPYFSLDKGADAGVGTLDLDYVRIWSERTELAINN
jgi:hypothetical protein